MEGTVPPALDMRSWSTTQARELAMGWIIFSALLLLFALGSPAQTREVKHSSLGEQRQLKDVLVLHQQTDPLGKVDLYLADDAGLLTAHGDTIIVCCSAPQWIIYFYSKVKKLAYTKTIHQGMDDTLQLFNAPVDLNLGKQSRGKSAFMQMEYKEIFIDGSKTHHVLDDPFVFQEREHRRVKDVTYRTLNVGTLKPQLQEFLWFIYSHHDLTGVPIELKANFFNAKSNDILRTTGIEKTQKPMSFFSPPTGLRKTTQKGEILFSDDYKSTLEDLFGSTDKKKH